MAVGTTTEFLRVDSVRLARRIETLAGLGTTRLAFSEGDRLARECVMDMMRQARLEVGIDAAANIIGRRRGRKSGPAILFGSHIDTVPGGGRYDGILGCLAGIEILHVLDDAAFLTDHPLEVIIFANEEGQTFPGLSGSRAMAGFLNAAELQRSDATGRSFARAMSEFGGNPDQLASARRLDVLAYLELHVEQGGVLESSGLRIGVVQGITGILHAHVRFIGKANHAGTTPMTMRHDALVAASRFVLCVDETIRTGRHTRVGTVGKLEVLPNAQNVIPGDVRLVLELRDLDEEVFLRAFEHFRLEAGRIAREQEVELEFALRDTLPPAICSDAAIEGVVSAAKDLGLSYHLMPSGAGHDAQMMARVAPMGMIFVPSEGGISHSDLEFTSAEDCANGANVLLHAVLKIDSWNDPLA